MVFDFPTEILCHIFSYFDLKTLILVSLLNQRFKEIVEIHLIKTNDVYNKLFESQQKLIEMKTCVKTKPASLRDYQYLSSFGVFYSVKEIDGSLFVTISSISGFRFTQMFVLQGQTNFDKIKFCKNYSSSSFALHFMNEQFTMRTIIFTLDNNFSVQVLFDSYIDDVKYLFDRNCNGCPKQNDSIELCFPKFDYTIIESGYTFRLYFRSYVPLSFEWHHYHDYWTHHFVSQDCPFFITTALFSYDYFETFLVDLVRLELFSLDFPTLFLRNKNLERISYINENEFHIVKNNQSFKFNFQHNKHKWVHFKNSDLSGTHVDFSHKMRSFVSF